MRRASSGAIGSVHSTGERRRMRAQHRLVYRASGKGTAQQIEIVSCQYHY
jgi:Txe/YoeB family toxin of Txe-Axe toxin-antitoxin module